MALGIANARPLLFKKDSIAVASTSASYKMRIKIDQADALFSRYIRLRDKRCLRCGTPGEGADGIIGLQASHYYGRARENTRFDPSNVDALCFGCHRVWGSDDREAYRAFKLQQLGEDGFNMLIVRANTYKKKDRKMELIIARELLKTL